MTSQQAREILQSYRPGVDAAEPQFAEALAQAQRDPELARWLARQAAVDAAVRDKLRAGPVPVGLQTRLLANAPAPVAPLAWWRQPGWLVAALIVLAALAMFWRPPTPGHSFTAYRAAMVQFVSQGYQLDVQATDPEKIRQAFAARAWPAEYVVPAGVRGVAAEGGCWLQWHGKRVSMLCFESPAAGDVWLFVAERTVTRDAPDWLEPRVVAAGKLTTASWTTGRYTYLLAAAGPAGTLERYLGTGG